MKPLTDKVIHDLVMLHLSKCSKATTIEELEAEYQENYDILLKIRKSRSKGVQVLK